MARIQLILPDADKEMYVHQARLEGQSLSSWLRAAARERLSRSQSTSSFGSPRDVEEFFRAIDERRGPDPAPEPDWDEHLRVIDQSRMSGISGN